MPTERTLAELVSIYWRTELAAQRTRSAAAAPTQRRAKLMPCPTCDHTMQSLDDTWHWCPRCGTLYRPFPMTGMPSYCEAPKLVERCREFAEKMNLGPLSNSLAVDEWRRLGIAESIHLPADRPNKE